MTFDYEAIRDDVVIPQIANFGKSATLTQPGVTTGDAWDPVQGTPVDYSVKVLELGPPGSAMTITNEAGSLLRSDDRRFMMSTDGSPDPSLKGTLTVAGDVLQVVGLVATQPSTTIMFWKVRCRR